MLNEIKMHCQNLLCIAHWHEAFKYVCRIRRFTCHLAIAASYFPPEVDYCIILSAIGILDFWVSEGRAFEFRGQILGFRV